jgi:D-alanyl-D-alanine carboxypeptidase (penicillin-binding protein 5/6)
MSADMVKSITRGRTERVKRYVMALAVGVVVVLVVVLVGIQWFRPLPSPVFRSAVSTSLRLPGMPPSLPWPTTGSAALSVEGVGSLGQIGSTQPVPIASIAKVLTAGGVSELV